MKRSVVAIAAIAAFAACFDDPTSGLRNGPAALVLERKAALVNFGDSIRIEVRLSDLQGNRLPLGSVEWASGNSAVAVVNPLGLVQDGGLVGAAWIRAASQIGEVTYVRVTARGVRDSIRVTSLPSGGLPAGLASVSGTASTDTLAGGAVVSAGDTLTINAPATQNFTTAAGSESRVLLGAEPAYILSRSATSIRAVSRGSYQGPVTVTNVRLLANAASGTAELLLAELTTADNVTLAKPRFRGTINVSGNILMTLTAPAGMTFSTAAPLSGVSFGASAATVISRTATQMIVSATVDYTGGVKVTNVMVGSTRLDSVKTAANQTIQRATFPGTVTSTGTDLLDAVTFTAGAGVTLSTSAPLTQVTSGGVSAFVVSRTATEIVAIPQAPGALAITNVDVTGTLFPSLPTAANVTFSSVTNETSEPGDSPSTSFPINVTTSDQYLYGAVSDDDYDDLFEVVLTGTASLDITLSFRGTGSGSAGNPDIDLFVLRDLNGNDFIFDNADYCDEFGGGFVESECTGVTAGQPESETTQPLAAGTYYILVELWDSAGITHPVVYQLRYRIIP
jgi:hypothetical protein